jgi:hypothetical protein
MLLGNLDKALGISDPSLADYNDYISIGKIDIIDYLEAHIDYMQQFLNSHNCDGLYNDSYCINQKNDKYTIFWLDHGIKRFCYERSSAAEIIAEYIFITYGLNR